MAHGQNLGGRLAGERERTGEGGGESDTRMGAREWTRGERDEFKNERRKDIRKERMTRSSKLSKEIEGKRERE